MLPKGKKKGLTTEIVSLFGLRGGDFSLPTRKHSRLAPIGRNTPCFLTRSPRFIRHRRRFGSLPPDLRVIATRRRRRIVVFSLRKARSNTPCFVRSRGAKRILNPFCLLAQRATLVGYNPKGRKTTPHSATNEKRTSYDVLFVGCGEGI